MLLFYRWITYSNNSKGYIIRWRIICLISSTFKLERILKKFKISQYSLRLTTCKIKSTLENGWLIHRAKEHYQTSKNIKKFNRIDWVYAQ